MHTRLTRIRHSGFTLLELMLAIAISVVISVGAYQVLTASTKAISAVKSIRWKLQPLQDLQWSLRQDLHGIVRASATEDLSALSALHLDSGNHFSLLISGINQTSFLKFNRSTTKYSSEGTGPTRTLRRTKVSNELAIRDQTDAFEFAGITLLKMEMAYASGNYSADLTRSFAQLQGQDNAVSPNQLPSSLQLTVEDRVLGKVILEFGIQ